VPPRRPPVTHAPIARQQIAAPTANTAAYSAGSAVSSFSVSTATPAVDVRISQGVAIGTAARRPAVARASRDHRERSAGNAVHAAPVKSTSKGKRS
jgi:hypothetical protein